MNADGGGARRITDRLARGSRVTWSPDGKKIAYVRTVRLDGTGDRAFGPDNGVIGHPHWS